MADRKESGSAAPPLNRREMPKPLDAVLARWPALFPEITGTSEQFDDNSAEAAMVRRDVIVPLLGSTDIARTFEESREAYSRWKRNLSNSEKDPEVLLERENATDNFLTTMLNDHKATLGTLCVKAALESVKLRRIARMSVLPHREIWPEGSWNRIGELMTNSELCLAGIVEHLATGRGSKGNVESLTRWTFENALAAYYDAGDHGRDSTRLEDIPEP